MEEACRRKLLQFLSVILGEPVQIKQILPQEGSQIAESGKKCSYFNTDIKLNLLENIIVQFVNQYPEFLSYYQDIITFRKKPEVVRETPLPITCCSVIVRILFSGLPLSVQVESVDMSNYPLTHL